MAESEHSDALTIGAIAVFAYVVATMLHEGLGHGGACLLTGGTLVNVATTLVCFFLGRLTSPKAARLRFFFWLTMAVSLYMPAGYFRFSGIGGLGGWALFIRGLNAQWAWRIGMTIFGAAAYLVAARFLLLELRPLIGSDKDARLVRAARLSRISYFTRRTLGRGIHLRRHVGTSLDARLAEGRPHSARLIRRTGADPTKLGVDRGRGCARCRVHRISRPRRTFPLNGSHPLSS